MCGRGGGSGHTSTLTGFSPSFAGLPFLIAYCTLTSDQNWTMGRGVHGNNTIEVKY